MRKLAERISSLLLLVVLATACAQLPKSLSVGSLLSPERLRVPIELQARPYLCGVTAVRMVASYYAKPLADSEYERLTLRAASMNGSAAGDLRDALRRASYFAALFSGEKSGVLSLQWHLEKKRPVIVMTGDGRLAHYLVITGYQKETNTFFANDPAIGPVAIRAETFYKQWDEARRLTVLGVPEKDGTIQ